MNMDGKIQSSNEHTYFHYIFYKNNIISKNKLYNFYLLIIYIIL